MIKKKIVGIYADKDSLHYVSIVKGISGYSLKSPGDGHSAQNIKHGNGYALLKTFLTELPVDNSRVIYLALPRSEVFMREITLPLMPVEDALLSIKNSLALYSHIEPDSIYYDVIVSERNGGGAFHGMLLYSAKDEIEKYQKLFLETGHGDSLKGIFPLSYGVSALLDNGTELHSSLFSLIQEDVIEIFVRSGRTLIFSISSPFDSQDEKDMILSYVENQFPQFKNMMNDLTLDSFSSSLIENRDAQLKFSYLPSFNKNHASAAVAPLIAGIQQISLDDQPVKIKIVHPFRYIVPFLCVLIVILYFVTDKMNLQSIESNAQLSEAVKQVKELESDLEPLQNKIDTLKKASRFKTDVQEFMKTRPALYTVLNEIAILVPDGTWFANFTFNGNDNSITLRGTGTDALKTVEALRSSELFDNVMLRGSVNRRPNGDENFTLALELKPIALKVDLKSLEPKVDPTKNPFKNLGGVE